MLTIQQAWTERRCPIINGIVFASGVIRWIDLDERFEAGRAVSDLCRSGETSIAILEKAEGLRWSDVSIIKEVVCDERGLLIQVGEGSMGGDGFVAALEYSSKRLLWVAFFENSNPFVDVKIEGDLVLATNNHGTYWSFPVHDPSQLIID